MMDFRASKFLRLFFGGVLMVIMTLVATVEIWSLVRMKRNQQLVMVGRSVSLGNKMVASVNIASGGQLEVNGGVVGEDARPLIIKKYLEKYNSPLVDYSDLIYALSKQYGFEYYWIPAIAQQESNLCKAIPEDSHNCWGYGINSEGTLRFDSYETALKSYAEYLKREYFDKGYDTPEKMMKKYCPQSDGSWAFGVNKFINQMETGEF